MLYTDSTLAWHTAHVRPLHTNNTKSPGSANNTDEAEGVKCLIHSCSREKEREEKEGWRGGKKKKRQRSRHSPATCHIPRQESSQRKEPFLQEATAAQESLLNPLQWREPARLTRGFQSRKEPQPCPLTPKKERERETVREG